MADATLGTAVLRTKLDRSGLKTGLNQAKGDTQKFAADSGAAIRGIGAAFGAIVASQGVRSYISFLRSSANLSVQADAANRLFEKSLQRTNQSLSEGAGLVDRLSSRFGVANSVIESSATLLLRQGASLDDIERALTAAGASAAAAGFDISTAFDNVATAVATGRSELLETSGIVTNLGPVTQQYARSIGKTVDELTEQEVIQARVNAIYRETASEIEDVDEILQGLPLAQAEVTKGWRTFREDVGGIAAEVLTPLTQGLGAVLGYVNDLPEPVKRAGLAMSGAAIGATALATGIVAIRTALTGFQALGLLSFGPAGWIVLGVTAVAGLVAVLTGKPDSLDAAAAKASAALASGDVDSLTGALDETIEKLGGDVKTTFENFRDDLRETGKVGVEEAQKIAAAYAALPELMEAQRRVIRAEAEVEGIRLATEGQVMTGFGSPDPANVEAMLRDTLAKVAPGLLEFLRFDSEANRFSFAPRADGSTVGVRDPDQSALVVEAVALANRQLAAPVSQLASAETELAAANTALQAILNRVQTPAAAPPPGGTTPPPGPTGTPADPVHVTLDDIRAVNEGRRDEDEFPRSATGANIRARFATPDEPTLNELVIENARRRFAEIDRALLAVSEEPIPPSLYDRVIANARQRFTAIDRGLPAALGFTDIGAPGATAVVPQAVSLTAPEVQAIVPAAVSLVDGLTAATAQLGDLSGTSIAEVRRRIRALESLKETASSAEARGQIALLIKALQDELTEMIRLATPVALTAPAVTAGLRPLTPGQEAFGTGLRQHRIREDSDDLANARRINEERARSEQQAADQFASTVVSAGFAMGDAAVKAIADGDIPGLLRAGLSGAGSILGGSNLGSIGFLGGSIGIGSLVAGGLGILGTIIGALAGGGRSDADRAAEQQRRVGNVPAINIQFEVNQTNTYTGGPSQPENEQAFRRQADALFESLYRRHLGPRLDRIESRLGIAGA